MIIPKPLTKANFSQYGEVICADNDGQQFSINDGYTMRYHDLAKIDVSDQNGRTLINIFRSNPLAFPISINMMERHPLGSQAFIPLGTQPYLVVVAPKGPFEPSKIEIFIAQSNQGVNYYKGTWHHFCLALNEVSDFIVIDRGGEGDNCDVETLDGKIQILEKSIFP